MAKKKDWIDRLKRFFGSDTKSKQEKKKKRKLWLFGRLKSKLTTALPAPPLSGAESLRDAEEAQNKQAMAVAVVAAAAAEAAVAAAQAAAQVVRLRGTFLSYHRSQGVAAIRIQTAFRGHLARKALRALRGLVRLQALIRGQVVRRQTAITLRSLQSLMKIQSEARATRGRMGEDHLVCEDKIIVHGKTKKSQDTRTMERRNSKRPSTPTAQETFVMNHRWSWLEWVGSQPLDTDIPQNPSPSPDKDLDDHHLKYFGRTRRSFNGRRASSRDADSITSFPSLPSYMAATESAKARFRSLSTPKQRVGPRDAFSEYHCSPSSNRLLSPFPSIVSEAGRSPTFCRRSEPVKSRRRCKYLSFDSECTLLNWDRHKAFT